MICRFPLVWPLNTVIVSVSVKKSELCVLFITVSLVHRWIGGSCDSTTHTLLLHAPNTQMDRWCWMGFISWQWVIQRIQEYQRYTACLTSRWPSLPLPVSVVLCLWTSSLSVHSGPWFKISQLRHAVNAKRGALLLQDGLTLAVNVSTMAVNSTVYYMYMYCCVQEPKRNRGTSTQAHEA